jgi:hypothetical protein
LFPSWVIIKNHWAKYIICMYGNVMMKPLTMYNLIYANKNSKPKAVIAFSQEIRYTKRFLCIHNSSCYTSILWISIFNPWMQELGKSWLVSIHRIPF